MATRFAFACSYQGTTWFKATDDSGAAFEVEFRHSLSDYERRTLNGGPDGAFAAEVESLLGYLVPRNYPATPLTLETVRAFNSWQVAECARWRAMIEGAPERYGELKPEDCQPRHVAKGAAYFEVTTRPTVENGYHCEGAWRFEHLEAPPVAEAAPTLESFLATFASPMARAKARKALERNGRFNGEVMPRYRYAVTLSRLPVLRLDRDKGRLYTGESTFFAVADLTETLVAYALHLRGGAR